MRVGVFVGAGDNFALFLFFLVVGAVLVLAERLLDLVLDGDGGLEAVLLRKGRRRDVRQQARDRLRVQLHGCQHFLACEGIRKIMVTYFVHAILGLWSATHSKDCLATLIAHSFSANRIFVLY
jgi:hypothetical protein